MLGQMLDRRIQSKLAPVIDEATSMLTEVMEGLLETQEMEKQAMNRRNSTPLETCLLRETRVILDIRTIMTITMMRKVIIHLKAVKAMTKDTMMTKIMTMIIGPTMAAGQRAQMIEETKILTLTLKSILLASTVRPVLMISEVSSQNTVRSNVSS